MIYALSIALIVNSVLLIRQSKENGELNKKLVEQIDLTVDALQQSKSHLADNISLLRIIEGSDTKEQIIKKYFLNKSLKK